MVTLLASRLVYGSLVSLSMEALSRLLRFDFGLFRSSVVSERYARQFGTIVGSASEVNLVGLIGASTIFPLASVLDVVQRCSGLKCSSPTCIISVLFFAAKMKVAVMFSLSKRSTQKEGAECYQAV